MDNSISYSSIAEIHAALSTLKATPRELIDYIAENFNDWKDGKTKDKILGSENEYHNLSVEFSRQNCVPFALAVATIGVDTYPMSTDLLADVIKYSQQLGNTAECQKGLEKLKTIDRKYWRWRTFVFVIDFLKDSFSSSSSPTEFETNISEARKFICEFKQYIPFDERAYVAEAEIYQHQGEYSKAIEVLQEGVDHISVAPQCCMKLADMYLEQGEYDEVEEYAKKGILAATQDQPTVSVGYLYYLLALSMDAKRIKQRQAGTAVDIARIYAILNAYKTADMLLVNEGRPTVAYRRTIEAKQIILKMEEGINDGEDDKKEGHEGHILNSIMRD